MSDPDLQMDGWTWSGVIGEPGPEFIQAFVRYAIDDATARRRTNTR